MTQTKTRALTEGALMVAAATALSYVKLLELPQGGSVCIGMLPIFLYCARWGCKESFLASFAYGLLQLIFSTALTPGARPRCCLTMCSPMAYSAWPACSVSRRAACTSARSLAVCAVSSSTSSAA